MSAPDWKVANTPQRACDTIAHKKEPDHANKRNAIPEPNSPITTDSRRLTVSATTPVGISNSRYVPSSTVPISRSCNGSSPSSTMRNTLKMVAMRRKEKPSAPE